MAKSWTTDARWCIIIVPTQTGDQMPVYEITTFGAYPESELDMIQSPSGLSAEEALNAHIRYVDSCGREEGDPRPVGVVLGSDGLYTEASPAFAGWKFRVTRVIELP